MALEYGMDVKTLQEVLGHASVDVTLDTYSHVTGEMQRLAAEKIGRTIGKDTVAKATKTETKPHEPLKVSFTPYRGRIRRRGTGCVSRISDTTWEGRYSPRLPDGKRDQHVIYAHSEEECERLLTEMIRVVKEQRAAQKMGY